MRLWWQSLSGPDWTGPYRQHLASHAQEVLGDLASFELRGLPAGSFGGHAPMQLLRYPYASHRLMQVIPEQALQAEREGFDVIVLGSYTEPHLHEVRSLVDVPVASMTEATLLAGCSQATTIGIVTITPHLARITREHVEAHGLTDRVGPIVVMQPEVFEDELTGSAFDDPTAVVERFKRAAAQCVAEGADVIVPGEGILSEVVRVAGVQQTSGATVVDCVGVTVLHAAFLALARQRAGLSPGRVWSYPRLPDDLLEVVRSVPMQGNR